MNKNMVSVFVLGIALVLSACHKKNYPAKTPERNIENNSNVTGSKDEAETTGKTAATRKPKVAVAKVITVDDAAAHNSVDGRLYYDVLGHRYWKNYEDGKYYLFNKSMYSDPAFKPK